MLKSDCDKKYLSNDGPNTYTGIKNKNYANAHLGIMVINENIDVNMNNINIYF